MHEEKTINMESSSPIPEESILTKQSLPYISKLLLNDTNSNKTSSVLIPAQFIASNNKYLKTNKVNDTQYLHATAKTLRAGSTSRIPLINNKMQTGYAKKFGVTKFYKGIDKNNSKSQKVTLEEDIELGESVNIMERNKYFVSQMSQWKEMFNNNNNVENIETINRITIDLRHYYSKKKEFLDVFSQLDKAGVKLSKIIEVIRCYRTGVAIKLHKIMKKYEALIDILLKLCYTNDMNSKAELNHRIKMINEATNEYANNQQKNEDEIKVLKNILKAKECEIRGRIANENALETEVKNLREMLHVDMKNYREMADDISARKSQQNRDDPLKSENMDLTNNLHSLNTVVKEMENSHKEKTAMLESMNKLIKGMIDREKFSVGVQVDDAELLWGAQHFLGSENNIKPEQKSEKNVQIYESPAKNATELVYTAKNEEKKLTEVLGLESVKDSVKAEQPNNNLKAIACISKNLTQNWNIPPFVIVFIANSLKESKEGRVLPWSYFKKLLYDIYEEKIKNSPEIYGSINTNYIPLEEFVLLYFLNKCKLRRLAEIKVIELLTSLKYYLAIWPRAKTFAQLSGFLKFGDQHAMETDTNNASSDIYLQDFYLTCFNLCRREKGALIEGTEGNTYFMAEKEYNVTSMVLPWLCTEGEKKDWNNVLKKNIKKNIEGNENKELIDLDILLSLYLDQYLQKKKSQQAKILKQFNKIFTQNEGIFTTEEISNVIQSAKMPKTTSPFAQYPSIISKLRAFLFALTTEANSYEIKAKNFMQGVYKFGLDSPFPFIYARVYLFGTSTEIEKEAYNIASNQGGLPGVIQDTGVKKNKQKNNDEAIKSDNLAPSLNAASTMFAQHFSILRELKTKCGEFKKDVEGKDKEKVWPEFEEIQKVLDLACQFLDFPIET